MDSSSTNQPVIPLTDDRDRRALAIAARRKIVWIGGGIARVQSERSDAFYEVESHEELCECPDFQKRRAAKRGKKCKHCRALKLLLAEHTQDEIATWLPRHVILPSERIRTAAGKISEEYGKGRRRPLPSIEYPDGQTRESTRRNSAYREMRDRVPQLLADLSRTLASEPVAKWGGQEMPIHDRLFAVTFRAFANRSLEDTRHELQQMARLGYISAAPCKNSLSAYMHDAALTPLLREALFRVAKSVRKIETMALIDSTGLASCMTQVYLDCGKGDKIVRPKNRWRKAHVVSGGVTGIIADVVLSDHERGIDNSDPSKETADVNFWPRLLRNAASVFPNLQYALGDKAYLSDNNIGVCDELGIKAWIPIKIKWDPTNKTSTGVIDLFVTYTEENAFFEEIYRFRSKIEGVFSSMKRTTSSFFRSHGTRVPKGKVFTDEQVAHANIAFENELLAKCLVHSLRRIVVLEKLHDEPIRFAVSTAFNPMPAEWYKTNKIEIDEVASDDDFGVEEDQDAA